MVYIIFHPDLPPPRSIPQVPILDLIFVEAKPSDKSVGPVLDLFNPTIMLVEDGLQLRAARDGVFSQIMVNRKTLSAISKPLW
jgi:hypothetical protein